MARLSLIQQGHHPPSVFLQSPPSCDPPTPVSEIENYADETLKLPTRPISRRPHSLGNRQVLGVLQLQDYSQLSSTDSHVPGKLDISKGDPTTISPPPARLWKLGHEQLTLFNRDHATQGLDSTLRSTEVVAYADTTHRSHWFSRFKLFQIFRRQREAERERSLDPLSTPELFTCYNEYRTRNIDEVFKDAMLPSNKAHDEEEDIRACWGLLSDEVYTKGSPSLDIPFYAPLHQLTDEDLERLQTEVFGLPDMDEESSCQESVTTIKPSEHDPIVIHEDSNYDQAQFLVGSPPVFPSPLSVMKSVPVSPFVDSPMASLALTSWSIQSSHELILSPLSCPQQSPEPHSPALSVEVQGESSSEDQESTRFPTSSVYSTVPSPLTADFYSQTVNGPLPEGSSVFIPTDPYYNTRVLTTDFDSPWSDQAGTLSCTPAETSSMGLSELRAIDSLSTRSMHRDRAAHVEHPLRLLSLMKKFNRLSLADRDEE